MFKSKIRIVQFPNGMWGVERQGMFGRLSYLSMDINHWWRDLDHIEYWCSASSYDDAKDRLKWYLKDFKRFD